MSTIHEDVQNYYGQQLQHSNDLKTDACCSKAVIPPLIKDILRKIHPDVLARYYGCGLVFPPNIQGCRVLDLGSGAGRDVYILSSLVGDQGYVVGVDMTKEQLDVANRFIDYHTQQFGFTKSNVEFRFGKIEQLTDDPTLKINSFDVVVSNCVVNLSPDKNQVLQQVYQMLKPGGELYFSDVYADRPVPEELRQNKVLWGECLSGALCESDLISNALAIGFTRPVLVAQEPIGVSNKDLEKLTGDIKFTSCTYRLFKPSVDGSVEDNQFGYWVTYQTPMIGNEKQFQWDESITFEINGQPQYLNKESAKILRSSRYSGHFKFAPVTDEKEIPKPTVPAAKNQSSTGCCSSGNC